VRTPLSPTTGLHPDAEDGTQPSNSVRATTDGCALASSRRDLGKELGSGHFAKVRLGTKKDDASHTVAIKCIKKAKGSKLAIIQAEVCRRPISSSCRARAPGSQPAGPASFASAERAPPSRTRQVDILKKVDHPYIVKCYDAFDTKECMFLVMEIMKGGELFDRIVDKGHFTEQDAVGVTAKLLSAIKYLHDIGIAHRDLKPENLLMADETENAEVKITDFGLSKVFDDHSTVMQTPCGTPGYIAPEVLQMAGYDKQCDLWSMGVIVYILLCGFPPFYADNDAQLFEKIKRGEYEFLRPYWDPISTEAKSFIRNMLVVDPKKRYDCDAAMNDPWLKAGVDALPVESLPTLVTELKATQAKRRMKAAFLAVQAGNKLSHIISTDGLGGH